MFFHGIVGIVAVLEKCVRMRGWLPDSQIAIVIHCCPVDKYISAQYKLYCTAKTNA